MTSSPSPAELPGVVLFYDKTGRVIDLDTYCLLHADLSYRFVARALVGPYEVVTAWFGMDQGPFADEERPLIFGTVALVTGTHTDLYEDREWFDATESEALARHQWLLETLQAAPPQPAV